MSKHTWQHWMKWIAGLIAAVAAAVAGYTMAGCAQSVPVVVQQQTLHCEAAVETVEGQYTFTGCRLNGSQSTEQGDTDAEAEADAPIKLELPETSLPWPLVRDRPLAAAHMPAPRNSWN
jgi:hypothetical protein